ncbi:MAG: rRNA maturation RNase YbeY [Bacillota bacterium]
MINVANEQDRFRVTGDMVALIERAVRTTLRNELVEDEVEVSIVLVDDPYIQGLNAEYRGKDCPTDVLSFAMEEGDDEIEYDEGEAPEFRLLGDIVISLETAQRQASEYGHSCDREIAFLTVHGMLHLLGYDHGSEDDDAELELMVSKQEAVLGQMGLARHS